MVTALSIVPGSAAIANSKQSRPDGAPVVLNGSSPESLCPLNIDGGGEAKADLQSEHRLRQLMDAVPAPVWSATADGTVFDDEVRAQEALRCAQDRLAQAAQASGLAQLSAAIAHEVNQPLAAIVANADACQRWLSADPPNVERARSACGRIVRDANAASDAINGIRALFKQRKSVGSAANVNDVILAVSRLMRDEIRMGSAEVRCELDAGLPPIAMDRVQIQQVLVNLIRNAMEATEPATQGARSISIRTLKVSNDQVRVEVVDQGKGLDDADRAFEPFFTTKPNGMGMGLAICRSIIQAHDGRMWAERNEPKGTRFVFTLPIRGSAES